MKQIYSAALLVCLLPYSQQAQAQTAPAAAPPLPTALSSAKRLFIGNAGDQENADCLRAYGVFYQGIDALHRFQLVLDPGHADLALELHYEIDLGSSIVSDHSKNSVRQFRLVVIDPHTHVLLWSLTERTNYALFQKNRNKNLDQTVAQLVSDFDSLTAPQPIAPNNKSRVSH